MHKHFHFLRFLKVIRLTWQTQPVLPYWVMLAAIPLFYLYFLSNRGLNGVIPNSDDPYLMFNTLLYGCGSLYAGLAYSEFSKPGTTVFFLMLPASVFEKWLAKTLHVFLIFPGIIWLTIVSALQGFEWITLYWFASRYHPVDWSSYTIKTTCFFFYLFVPVAYVSGLLWRKLGLLKGFLAVMVLGVFLWLIILLCEKSFGWQIGWYPGQMPLIVEVMHPFSSYYALSVPYHQTHVWTFWVLGAFVPWIMLMVSSYLFIRQKEL